MLVTSVFSVSKLIAWCHSMSSLDLATRFKIGIYLFNRRKRFSKSNIYNTSLSELSTDNKHIKVPQNRLLCII